MACDVSPNVPLTNADSDNLVDETFELRSDSLKANQLRTALYRNEVHDPDTRTDVTGRDGHLLWGGTYTIHIACRKQKLRFGALKGKPACLIVFDMIFTTSLTRSVYRSAMVRISLDDCERADLISQGIEEDDLLKEINDARPRILRFQPSMFVGDRPPAP